MNRFLLWLFGKLIFSGTLFFAAASVAAPSDPVAEAVEPAEAEPAEHVQPEEPAAEEPAAEPGAEAVPKVDGRTLSPEVRNFLKELQAKNPKAHGELKDILHRDREINRQFPGGLKEITELKAKVDSFEKEFPGGLDAVREEQAEWRGIDEAWNNSDPRVIDVWMDANPEAFSKLMPVALDKFAQKDPESYQRWGSRLVYNSIRDSGFLGNLSFIERAVQMGDKENALKFLKENIDWLTAIKQTADSQPKAPAADPTNDQRVSELDERESKIWANETASHVNPYRSNLIRSEAKHYLPKGAELDDETFEAIDAQVQRYADKVLMADPAFIRTFSEYAEARDSAGMIAFMKQKLNETLKSKDVGGKHFAGAIEKATKLFFRGATPVKAAPKSTAPAKPAAKPAPGWEKVAIAPKPHEIAAGQFENVFQKAALLKNGKKVYWGDAPPAA